MPKISVILISYNSENKIERALESIANQTFKNFELILVDKNSKDKTLEFAGKYKNIITKWISEPCKSDYDAMNKGVLLAQGEYIIFLNAKNYFSSEDVLNTFSENFQDADILYGKVSCGLKIINPKITKKYALCEGKTYISSEFIKRNLLENMGGFDTRYRMLADYEFNLRAILKKNANIKFVNKIIANVEEHKNLSLTPKNVRRYYKEKYVLQRAYFKPFLIFINKILYFLFKN